jgi:hypothetical protein
MWSAHKVTGADGEEIAQMHAMQPRTHALDERQEANARLIVAAPEMVEELIQCEAILSLGPWNGTLYRVRQVLTKALGPDWQNETSAATGSERNAHE